MKPQTVQPKPQEHAKRTYEPPAVVYEARLEVRAGSALGINPLDMIGDPD